MSVSRKEVEKRIVEKAVKDENFRNRLKSDPKGTLESELQANFPADLNVHVNHEGPNDVHITLPHSEKELGEGELSGEQLSGVSGGWTMQGCTNTGA